MRLFTVLVILFAQLAAQLNLLMVHSRYLLQKKYYSEVLCENKAKPLMHCAGRCALGKEMNEEQQRQEKMPVRSEFKQEYIPVSLCESVLPLSPLAVTYGFPPLANPVAIDTGKFVFQPPEV
ncbi:MAG: hypothetical protein RMK52_01560 [Chitinophagales bacterium]|nr:hypothetical protein [Chitinophagales bacterium]